MGSCIEGMKIAVLGGDDRERFMIEQLESFGAIISVVGLPLQETKKVKACKDIIVAIDQAKVIILPLQGIDSSGKVTAKFAEAPIMFTEDIMQRVPRDALIFIGKARNNLMEMAAKVGFKVIELSLSDQLAVLNSVPTAEGAIQTAMTGSNITLHGSKAVVFGFGRCGMTLARTLDGLGANTYVVARNPADLARAIEMGLQPLTYKELPGKIKDANFIFNTVPALILNREILNGLNSGAYIIDIASAPGGVDFKAAGEFGIKAELALGLPGKVAPKTAGCILAQVIPELIKGELR